MLDCKNNFNHAYCIFLVLAKPMFSGIRDPESIGFTMLLSCKYFLTQLHFKIIKIRIPSQPCHIMAIHSEMCPCEAVALLICKDFCRQFCQFFIFFSIQRIEKLRIQTFLSCHNPQEQWCFFRNGDFRNHIRYIKMITSYQAKLGRTFQIQSRISKLFVSGLYQEIEITGIIHVGKTCHLLPASRSEFNACFHLDMSLHLPSCHQAYVITGIQGFLSVKTQITRTLSQAGVAVIGLTQGGVAHIQIVRCY